MKRSSLLFCLCVAVFIVGVFFLKQQVGPHYDWTPTFSPTDRNPFGTALFDTLMTETMPNGYRVENTSLADYVKTHPKSTNDQVLAVENTHYLNDAEMDSIWAFVEKGNTVVLAEEYPNTFQDSLVYSLVYENGYFDFNKAQRLVRSDDYRLCDTLAYMSRSYLYPNSSNEFAVRCSLIAYSIKDESDWYKNEKVIGFADRSKDMLSIAHAYHVGKGKIYIVSVPYLFSNFAVMDADMRSLSLRLMNELAERPVVHVHKRDMEEELADDGLPILTYVKKQPPLLFAWRLALVGALLALLVNSRRRRRAIPVKREEPNTTVSFLRQLARLYRKRSDHSSLVHKHYRNFADRLQRHHRLDVQDKSTDVRRHVTRSLASLTGRTVFDVGCDLDELDRLHETIPPVTPQMYRRAVELMERLTPKH